MGQATAETIRTGSTLNPRLGVPASKASALADLFSAASGTGEILQHKTNSPRKIQPILSRPAATTALPHFGLLANSRPQNPGLTQGPSETAGLQQQDLPKRLSRLQQWAKNKAGTISDAISSDGIAATIDQALEPAPGTGPVSRYFLGLGRMGKGIVQFPIEVAKEVADPENPLLDEIVPGGSAIEKFLIRPQIEEYRKARRAAEEGRSSESFGHSVAAGLPFFGPIFAGIAERAGSGDIAGAMGEATGFGIPFWRMRMPGRQRTSPNLPRSAPSQRSTPTRNVATAPRPVQKTGSRAMREANPNSVPVQNKSNLHPSPVQQPVTKLSLSERRTLAAENYKKKVIKEAMQRAPIAKEITGTLRVARRDAMRTERIPTSQKPIAQTSKRGQDGSKGGRQYFYEQELPFGETLEKVATNQLRDKNHPPHVEAGVPKPPNQIDWAGRRRHYNNKTKVTPTRR